jgi:pyridoxine 5-phosphate synthase
MTKLSVNINKIATLRNARGGRLPDPVQAAVKIQEFGADGITVHPRPDERHIRYHDVFLLREVVHTEFNIEGYPDDRFLELIEAVVPEQVTLVPDPPHVLTSNAGWDVAARMDFLKSVIVRIKRSGCRVSLFLDPVPERARLAKEAGADRIELYTESFASGFSDDPEESVRDYVSTAAAAHSVGLGINAGHDLNLDNLGFLHQRIPFMAEVSIGHALIADALYLGLEETVKRYKALLVDNRQN